MKVLLKEGAKLLPLIKKIIKREKKLLRWVLLFLILLIALPFLSDRFLIEVPTYGGEINEIKIGKRPQFINPILAVSQSDRDLLPLIYTPLLERNSEGLIVPAAASLEISKDQKEYFLDLIPGIYFSNDEELKADDIIFTIEKIQDPSLNSPYYSNWLDVKVEKINDYKVKITLPEEYEQFKNILTNLYIMPRSAWTGIQPSEFPYNSLNIHPIGSGPYVISKIVRDPNSAKIRKYELVKNENYYKDKVFIDNLNIYFFDNYEKYQKSLLFSDRKSLKAISAPDIYKMGELGSEKSFLEKKIYKIKNPKVFGIFLGKNYNKNLSDISLREVIAHSIDRKKIVNEVLRGYAQEADNIFPIILSEGINNGESEVDEKGGKNRKKEEKLKNYFLDDGGYLINQRTKKAVSLKIATLKGEEFEKVAQEIQSDLRKIGINTEITLYEEGDLINNLIRGREFEILIYGYQVDLDPDFYYLFHSSQVSDPGINIAGINDKKVDELLLELRKKMEDEERLEKMKKLNDLILKDYSFIPLYQPDYIYLTDARIRNFQRELVNSPEERFVDIDK